MFITMFCEYFGVFKSSFYRAPILWNRFFFVATKYLVVVWSLPIANFRKLLKLKCRFHKVWTNKKKTTHSYHILKCFCNKMGDFCGLKFKITTFTTRLDARFDWNKLYSMQHKMYIKLSIEINKVGEMCKQVRVNLYLS